MRLDRTTYFILCSYCSAACASSTSLFGIPLYERFSSLQTEEKIRVLSDLLARCSYEEKTIFFEIQLHRDFLSCLPPEIAIEILRYLSIDDLVSGLQVCRSWRWLIAETTSLWKNAACKMGLKDLFVEANLPDYGTIIALTTAAWKQRKFLSSATTTTLCPLSSEAGIRVECEQAINYYWAGKGVVVCHADCGHLQTNRADDSKRFSILLKYLNRSGHFIDISEVANVPMSLLPSFPVVATENGLLIWRGCDYEQWVWLNMMSDEPTVYSWRPGYIHEYIVEDACDVCRKCGLVGKLPVDLRASRLPSAWAVDLVKLMPGGRTEAMSCQLKAPLDIPIDPDEDSEYVENLFVIPGPDGSPVCSSHYLLVQVGMMTSVSCYQVPTTIPEPGLFTAVHVFVPPDLCKYHSSLAVSADSKLVGLFGRDLNFGTSGRSTYHIWELVSGKYHSAAIPAHSVSCLALGHLYSILECRNRKNNQVSVCVVSTFTGEIILSCDVRLPRGRIERGKEAGQEWINKCDSLPLTQDHLIAIEYWAGSNQAHEIHSVRISSS